METLGWLIYTFLYYSVLLLFYIFKAALDHGRTSAAAVVLVVFVLMACYRH